MLIMAPIPPPVAIKAGCHGHHAMAYYVEEISNIKTTKPLTYFDSHSVVPLHPFGSSTTSRELIPRMSVSNIDHIVVPTTSEKFTIQSPLQTTDLSIMTNQFHHFMLRDVDIVVPDLSILTTRAEQMLIPAHHSNLHLSTVHCS
jgi:hypothetical protein